jgi:hypothetical protein
MKILKNILVIVINIFLFWILWFFINTILGFIEWAYSYQSLDFNHWWRNDLEEGSLGWGIFVLIASFPIAFYIVKKLNIKF